MAEITAALTLGRSRRSEHGLHHRRLVAVDVWLFHVFTAWRERSWKQLIRCMIFNSTWLKHIRHQLAVYAAAYTLTIIKQQNGLKYTLGSCLIMLRQQFILFHVIPILKIKIPGTQLKKAEIEQGRKLRGERKQQQVCVSVQWRGFQNSLHADRPQTRTAPNKTQRAAADKTRPLQISFPTSDSAARTKCSPVCALFLGRTESRPRPDDGQETSPTCLHSINNLAHPFWKQVRGTFL